MFISLFIGSTPFLGLGLTACRCLCNATALLYRDMGSIVNADVYGNNTYIPDHTVQKKDSQPENPGWESFYMFAMICKAYAFALSSA